ncbi:MAG TPA: class I SAM-dependent methyltransferase [Reyranella sp.]|nr:class I SAM-dependent methyltransferase [Reyranella sp.]
MTGPGQDVETKHIFSEAYRIVADYHSHGIDAYKNELRPGELASVRRELAAWRIAPEAKVVEIGCGLGHLHTCHPNWQGFEYADTAVALGKTTYGETLNIVEADARNLPLEPNSVDFLFTFDALEHIPNVEQAFAEIERIMKPGGIAMLVPAWNCRSWTVKKLQMRPYAELTPSEKIGKFLIPLRDHIAFRLLCNLPGRALRELRLLFGAAVPLDYTPLTPDTTLWYRYDRGADDDAFISMDAHAAIAYFRARGWQTPSHPTFWKRFSVRSGPVVVRKPA